ncbi:hypothetical protein IV02_17820 [Pseudomonas syringae]|uniref:Uncharacterized protein n=1 Tax=Pseudomonas syringae TaxID=317 RepID=A0A085V4C3_PSESX|nr:hypothetical protein IV02_17820 [Pseudomonas syringae]
MPNPLPDRDRPTMASHRLDLPSMCDICDFARSIPRHQLCSKIRQQRKTDEWAAVMAEKKTARAAQEKRYAR